jgi:hypothetical protein
MGSGTATRQSSGLLDTLDAQITRHQSAISLVTGILAVLGVSAMFLGVARVAPLLRVLSPF